MDDFYNDEDDFFGDEFGINNSLGMLPRDFLEILPKEQKKRGRKSKKNNEKQLLNEFADEIKPKTNIKNIPHNPPQKNSSPNKTPQSSINNYKSTSYNTNVILPDINKLEHKFTKPKNKNQEEYVKLLQNINKKIVIVTGPAGTGKTLFATEYGISGLLNGVYEKIIFTRPSICVDEDLGYLPGTMEEKMSPYVRPIFDILYNFISPKEVETLMEEKIIEIIPLGFMRGRTFKKSWIICDEMQNSTISQMKMLLTRIGEKSRIIVTGDLEQNDKKYEVNGLEDFLNLFYLQKGKRSDSITSIEFDKSDIHREEVVKDVLNLYSFSDNLKYNPITPSGKKN
jgi:phosphate starvation-inducible PhoH-like protein